MFQLRFALDLHAQALFASTFPYGQSVLKIQYAAQAKERWCVIRVAQKSMYCLSRVLNYLTWDVNEH